MNVFYEGKATKALNAKLEYLEGRGSRKLAIDIAAALELGNENDRLRGLDRYGKPQPPVKPRTGKYKGASGPPLAPFGSASRVISHFKAKVKGSRPPYRIVAGWENVVSKKGVPFLPFLDQGVRNRPKPKGKPEPKRGLLSKTLGKLKQLLGLGGWYIPPRPHFGISPNTWVLIRERIQEFKDGFHRVK